MTFGEVLRATVAEQGHTMHRAAMRSGISPSKLYATVNHDRGMTVRTLAGMAATLEFSDEQIARVVRAAAGEHA